MDVVVIQNTPIFIFLYPQQPAVIEGVSVVASCESVRIVITATSSFIDAQIYELTVPETVSIYIFAQTPAVVAPRELTIPIERRMRRSAWQARLGAKLDPIKRKLLDNNILLSAHPTDMLRIRVARDPRTHDIRSRTIISSEILPVMLPTMQDVPMRRLVRDDTNQFIVATFSMLEDQKAFEAFCPLSSQLQREDLLFRILKDPHAELPYVMALQVKDELATFSYASLLYVKYLLTFYDEPLPPVVITEILKATKKREFLSW